MKQCQTTEPWWNRSNSWASLFQVKWTCSNSVIVLGWVQCERPKLFAAWPPEEMGTTCHEHSMDIETAVCLIFFKTWQISKFMSMTSVPGGVRKQRLLRSALLRCLCFWPRPRKTLLRSNVPRSDWSVFCGWERPGASDAEQGCCSFSLRQCCHLGVKAPHGTMWKAMTWHEWTQL